MSFGGSFRQVGYATAGRSSILRRRYARHPADEMFLADNHIFGKPLKRKPEKQKTQTEKSNRKRRPSENSSVESSDGH